jgi:hypothetical protein
MLIKCLNIAIFNGFEKIYFENKLNSDIELCLTRSLSCFAALLLGPAGSMLAYQAGRPLATLNMSELVDLFIW